MHRFMKKVMESNAIEVKLQNNYLNAGVDINSEETEENIRKIKLANAKKTKEELEQMLGDINDKILKLHHDKPIKYLSKLTSERLSKDNKIESKEDKKKYEEELEKKKKEASEFIQVVNAGKKERLRRQQERQKVLEEKKQKKEEERKQRLKEKEEEALKKRKEETMKIYENIKRKREEELKKREETRANISLPLESEYLYKKLEENYNNKVVLPSLEEKKKELARKRSHFKSFNKEEFEDHVKKYDLLMAQKKEARKNELKLKKKRERILYLAMAKLRTAALEKQSLEEAMGKEEEEKRRKERNERQEKLKRFVEQIKITHPVKISTTKAEELKKQIEKLKHPVRRRRDTRKEYDLAKINNRSMGTSSEPQSDEKSSSRFHKRSQASRKNNIDSKKLTIEQKSTTTSERKDYLRELRKQGLSNKTKHVRYNWNNDIRDSSLNSIEKYNKVVEKANLIEEQAKRKEQMLKAKGGTEKDPDMGEVVSGMFVDAIKAKLAILENL